MHLIKSRFRGRADSPIEKIGLGKLLRAAISAPRVKGLRNALEQAPGAERRVVYAHIPFCSTRCPYCPFHVGLAGALREPFVEATVKLIETLGNKPFVSERPFDVYYFGGGSPTSLLAPQLERILKALMEKFPPSPGHEFTVESTIGDLDAEKLAMLKELGVTRISVGVQSFDTQVRRSVGRASGQDAVLRALELLGKSGLRTAVDLMYGIPGQTVESTAKDVETACRMGLNNISHFRLKLFVNTAFYRGMKDGTYAVQDSMDEMREMQRAGIRTAKSMGYHHWHVTDYGKTPDELCRYTEVVRGPRDMVALGTGGCGFRELYKYRTETNLKSYVRKCHAGEYPLFGILKDSMERYYIRKVRGQLEVGQLDLAQMGRLFDIDAPAVHKQQVESMAEAGWLTVDGTRVRFTEEGYLHADEVRENLKIPRGTIKIKFEDYARRWAELEG